jgi:SAM-dependent methyltransferase
VRLARRGIVALTGPDDPRIADADRRSPLVSALELSEHADREELRFREEVEPYRDGLEAALGFFRRKRVLNYLDHVLRRTGVRPRGTVVELGAGSCWLSAAVACFPEVERVVAVDFSQRRLGTIGPASLALLEAPAEKVERRVADFYAHGLEPGSADLVLLDASFHHASDPVRLGRVAFDLLRPGGTVLLLREPTLTPLHRSRDHGIEGEHGHFEREYRRAEYVDLLRRAGFEARDLPVRWFYTSWWRRLLYRPPLAVPIAFLRGSFVYLGRKPS